jgi:hypothetical protein
MSADVAALLDEAQQVYGDDPAARAALEGYARRLGEPLRVAVDGMVRRENPHSSMPSSVSRSPRPIPASARRSSPGTATATHLG